MILLLFFAIGLLSCFVHWLASKIENLSASVAVALAIVAAFVLWYFRNNLGIWSGL